MARVLHEWSAGAVVLVPMGGEVLTALILIRGGTLLALPKGHIEPGEEPADTALREAREETGIVGELLTPLDEIAYFYWSRARGARVSKRVSFFLLAYRAGSPAHHDHEVDGVRLVPAREAPRLLAYEGERTVMGRALAWLAGAGERAEGAKLST